jgi:hypothetical protein
MRTLFVLYAILVACCCKQESPTNDLYNVHGQANGNAIHPTVNGTAAANLTGLYVRKVKRFDYDVNFAKLSSSPISVCLYANADSTSKPVHTIDLTNGGTAKGFIWLDHLGDSLFVQQQWHFTINTQQYPHGEARGKIAVTK